MKSALFLKFYCKIVIGLLLFIAIGAFLFYELPPRKIEFVSNQIEYGDIFIESSAQDLIGNFQNENGIWASRGYTLYLLKDGKDYFERIATLPVPFGLSSYGNSRILRNIFNKHELVELLFLNSNTIIAFAGGFIFSYNEDHEFEVVKRIEKFGFREGRGIMPHGIALNKKEEIFYGEYWRNPERAEVKIWKGKNEGKTWEVFYTFPAEKIRHIHAVQYDPYSEKIWVATGDRDNECKIGYFNENGEIIKIGKGSQKWRAVSLIFTEEAIYWGMDGISDEYPENLIWKWNRATKETESLQILDSKAFYSSKSGENLIITTDGKNGAASLWMSNNGEKWDNVASFPRKRINHSGIIRVVSDEKGSFYITTLNLKKFNNQLLKINF